MSQARCTSPRRGARSRHSPCRYRKPRYTSPFSTSTHIAAKCQCRAPASQPPKVSQLGAGVPSHGQQQKPSPRRAKRGYALKMRSPEPAITVSAIALIQWVTRTTQ
jgi:hypothetical protein